MDTTNPHDAEGFLLPAGSFIRSLLVRTRKADDLSPRTVQIVTWQGDVLAMPDAMALGLIRDLVTAMYDAGTLDMATAEHLVHKGNSVLVDEQVPLTDLCPACHGAGWTGIAPDPDTCQYCKGTGLVTPSGFAGITLEEYQTLEADNGDDR